MSDIKDNHIEMIEDMFGDKTESTLDDALINIIFGSKEQDDE